MRRSRSPLRSRRVLLFDDVLNSGKHFKAQQLLAQRFPDATILAVFLARCLPDPPVAFDPL
jgi:hypoxanthine-guanine phosphoribosyltransferase